MFEVKSRIISDGKDTYEVELPYHHEDDFSKDNFEIKRVYNFGIGDVVLHPFGPQTIIEMISMEDVCKFNKLKYDKKEMKPGYEYYIKVKENNNTYSPFEIFGKIIRKL